MDAGGVGEDSSKREGRRGEQAVVRMPAGHFIPALYVKTSALGGVVGGSVLLTYYVVTYATGDVLTPFRILASVLLSHDIMRPGVDLAVLVPVAILDHFLISVFWGLVFGLVLACSRYEWGMGSIVTLGILFGAIVWLVDFHVLAPVFWPWLTDLSSAGQFIGHAFLYGMTLGIWVALRTQYAGK